VETGCFQPVTQKISAAAHAGYLVKSLWLGGPAEQLSSTTIARAIAGTGFRSMTLPAITAWVKATGVYHWDEGSWRQIAEANGISIVRDEEAYTSQLFDRDGKQVYSVGPCPRCGNKNTDGGRFVMLGGVLYRADHPQHMDSTSISVLLKQCRFVEFAIIQPEDFLDLTVAADRYKGVVFTGPDHGTIGLRGPTFDVGFPERKNLNFVGEQGFVTNSYRFVYRKEAAAIAIAAGQIAATHYLPDGELDSRDVKGTPGYTGAKSIFREGQ
jgi:hypothetical protein